MNAKEILPNPCDLFQSLRYLQDQAAQGAFTGHTTAYHVMLHLTMNAWTKLPNKEDAPIGAVMYGRSAVDSIAAHTTLCRRTVQRSLKWLAEEGWIETDRAFADTGREDKRFILVLLDSRAHRERDRIRQAGEAAERILSEA